MGDGILTKRCTKCGIEKPLGEFYKSKKSIGGYRSDCKVCCENQRRDHKLNPVTKIVRECQPGTKFCTKCKNIKSISEFGKNGRKDGGLRSYCKKCSVKYATDYVKNHQDRRKKYMKEYSKQYSASEHGKSIIKIYRDEYLKTYIKPPSKNPELIKEKQRIRANKVYHTPKGKEDQRERSKKYYSTSKGKISRLRGKHRRRDLEKKTECNLTDKQWSKILKMQDNRCYECHKEFGHNLKPTKDHIIPVTRGGGLTFGNIRALCGSCNSSKLNNMYFMQAIDTLLVAQ